MSQPPDDHLKALWKGQKTESPTMTVMAIRALARNYGDQVRGGIWLGFSLVALETVVFSFYAWRAPNAIALAGDLLVLAGLAWFTFRILRRRPGRLPPADVSVVALIEFHRAELERQKMSFSNMVASVGPMLTGTVVLVVGLHNAHPAKGWIQTAPFFVLLVGWFVLAFILQRRQAGRLAEQIAEMDELAGR
jgi:hypothetical protein